MFKNKIIVLLIIGSLQGIVLQAMVAEKKQKVESETSKKEGMTIFHITIINKTNMGYEAFNLLNFADATWNIPANRENTITLEGELFPKYPNPRTNLLRIDSTGGLHDILIYVTYPLSNVGSSRIKTINVQVDYQTTTAKHLASTDALDIIKNPELFIAVIIEGSYPFIRASMRDETAKKSLEYKRLKEFVQEKPI